MLNFTIEDNKIDRVATLFGRNYSLLWNSAFVTAWSEYPLQNGALSPLGFFREENNLTTL